jgi:hypothetical protein
MLPIVTLYTFLLLILSCLVYLNKKNKNFNKIKLIYERKVKIASYASLDTLKAGRTGSPKGSPLFSFSGEFIVRHAVSHLSSTRLNAVQNRAKP